MDDGFVFYTHGSSIELNGRLFTAGELTEDLLNLSPKDYRPMRQRLDRVLELSEQYGAKRDAAIWWELNEELELLCSMLRRYTVFQLIIDENDDVLFSETRQLTEQFGLFPNEDFDLTERDMEVLSERNNAEEGAPIPDLTPALLVYPGKMEEKWTYYKMQIARYKMYLHDIRAFNGTIRNFIKFMLSDLKNNSAENYAVALYNFYNDPYLADKLIVNPIRDSEDCYTRHDSYMLSYVPRELPDGSIAICQEHVTDSLQALMKADYMLALNNGYNIRRCIICGRYFLLKTGAHALYCEGACPHAPMYTCRQFGTYEVQKELAHDIPKVRAKLTAFERITKDAKRGAITKEDARKAKDYVRDKLYDALRSKDVSVDEFECSVSSEKVYAACNITRTAKPRGRPKKVVDG